MTEHEQRRLVRHRLAILHHAEEVTGNVSATCRYYGISRQCFYKWRNRFDELGEEGLRDRSSRPHRGGCHAAALPGVVATASSALRAGSPVVRWLRSYTGHWDSHCVWVAGNVLGHWRQPLRCRHSLARSDRDHQGLQPAYQRPVLSRLQRYSWPDGCIPASGIGRSAQVATWHRQPATGRVGGRSESFPTTAKYPEVLATSGASPRHCADRPLRRQPASQARAAHRVSSSRRRPGLRCCSIGPGSRCALT